MCSRVRMCRGKREEPIGPIMINSNKQYIFAAHLFVRPSGPPHTTTQVVLCTHQEARSPESGHWGVWELCRHVVDTGIIEVDEREVVPFSRN